jgi:hypothetical protein
MRFHSENRKIETKFFYYGRVPTGQILNNLNIAFFSIQFRSQVPSGYNTGPFFLWTSDLRCSSFSLPAVAVQCHVRPPERSSVTYCKQSSSFADNLLSRLFRLVATRNYVEIISQIPIWQGDLQFSEQNRLSIASCSAGFFICAWI